jgi:hypothetical protein
MKPARAGSRSAMLSASVRKRAQTGSQLASFSRGVAMLEFLLVARFYHK